MSIKVQAYCVKKIASLIFMDEYLKKYRIF